MNRLLDQIRCPLALLLAVWIAILGVGISIRHTHTDGGSHHSHGFGWYSLNHPLTTGSSKLEPPEPHRHWLLLGLEIPGVSSPDLTDADQCLPKAEAALSVDTVVPDRSLDHSESTDVMPIHYVGCRPRRSSTRVISPVGSSSLSAFAAREVSGVQRL